MVSGNIVRAAVFAILLTPLSSVAEQSKRDVQDLPRMCKTPVGGAESTFCLAFIAGVAEQMIFTGELASLHRKEGGLTDERDRKLLSLLSACTSASFGAMVQAFTNWAERHPEEWTTCRQIGVVKALSERWPCK